MNNLKKSLTNDLSTLSSKNLVNKISDIDYTEIKNESFNTIQYTLISVLPVMIILKTIKHLFPLVNPNNSTLEILLESLGQLSLTMFLIVLSNYLVRLIPTYSGVKYSNVDNISYVLPFLFLILTMQTKIGDKINILSTRFLTYINGDKQVYINHNQNTMLPPNTLSRLPKRETNEPHHYQEPARELHRMNQNHQQQHPSMNTSQQQPQPQQRQQQQPIMNTQPNPSMNQQQEPMMNEPTAANLGTNSLYSAW
jgi:hypothetical protein